MRVIPTLLFCGLVLVGLPASPGHAQSDVAIQRLLENIAYWQQRGQDERVADLWRKVLESDPSHAQGLIELAQYHAKKGDQKGARVYIERLRKVHPDHPDLPRLMRSTEVGDQYNVLLDQARKLVRQKRVPEALAVYRKAFGEQAPSGRVGLEYYETLGGQPDGWEEARQGFERLRLANPSDEEVQLVLARHLTYNRDDRKARLAGIETLERLATGARDADVRKRARDAWRLALEWSKDNPANAALMKRYLKVDDDPKVREWMQGLHAKTARVEAVKKGDAHFDAGRFDDAEDAYRAHVGRYPYDATGYVGLAKIAMHHGRYAEAKEHLEAALKRARGDRRILAFLADVDFWLLVQEADRLRGVGQLREAEESLQRALARAPSNAATADLMLGNVLAAQGKRDLAMARFEAVLAAKGHEQDPAALSGMIQMLIEDGRTDEALRYHDRLQAIELDPKTSTLAERDALRVTKVRSQAMLHVAAGRNDLAREILEKALRDEALKKDKWLLHDLVNLHLSMRDVPAARARIDELLALQPSMRKALLDEARVLAEEGRFADAYRVVQNVASDGSDVDLELMKRDLLLRSTTARIAQQAGLGSEDEARRALESLEGEVSDNPALLASVALSWCQLGDARRGLAVMKRALARAGDPSPSLRLQYGAVLLMAGRDRELNALLSDPSWQQRLSARERRDLESLRLTLTLQRVEEARARGDVDHAFRLLRPGLEHHPDEPRVLVTLGNLFLDKGDHDEAYAVFERRLAADPGDLEAREGAVRAAQALGLRDEARALVDEGLVNHPDSPRMELIAARYESARGHDEHAQVHLQRALVLDEQARAPGALSPHAESKPGSVLTPDSDYDEIVQVAIARFDRSAEGSAHKGVWTIRGEIEREIERMDSRYAADAAFAPTFRYRHGEAGLGRLFAFRAPLTASLPIGFAGRIRALIAPEILHAGSLSLATGGPSARFGRIGTVTLAEGNPSIEMAEQGVALELAYEYQGFYLHGGTTPLGFPIQSWAGGIGWGGSFGGFSVAVDVSRSLLDDSLLARAGAVDPLRGDAWGLVTRNGLRLDLSFTDGRLLAYLVGGFAWLLGEGVQDNTRMEVGAGVHFTVHDRKALKVKTGLALLLMGHERNLRFFTSGHSGVFSPRVFGSAGIPLMVSGERGRLIYEAGGDAGLNWFHEEESPYYPLDAAAQTARARQRDLQGDPAQNVYPAQTSLGFGLNAQGLLGYRFSSQFVGGLQAQLHLAGDYQEFLGGFFLGYGFRPDSTPTPPCVPAYWRK